MSKVIFSSSATAKNGRDGHVKSSDGLIDLDLVNPATNKEDTGSNPEQLFASAYSACFDGALNMVADQQSKKIDSETSVEAHFCKDESDGGFKIAADIYVKVSGVSKDEAEKLVQDAHQACPYSKATRGNIDVNLNTEVVE